MKKIVIVFLFLITPVFAANFGQYQYSSYSAINRQLQAQRMRAMQQNRARYYSPTRNIQYPSANNPYPNIQRSNYNGLTPNQRYSPAYYNSL